MSARQHMLTTLALGFETLDCEREAFETAVDVIAIVLREAPEKMRRLTGRMLVDAAINRLDGTAMRG